MTSSDEKSLAVGHISGFQIDPNKLMDKQMTITAFSDELAQVRTKKKE